MGRRIPIERMDLKEVQLTKMSTESSDTANSTSAQASLAGYWYQLKVSVLFALDLLVSKQQTDQITLEPANEEDLEIEMTHEPGALTQKLTIKTRKLTVQCKLRSTGPWTISGIKSLLLHGTQRTPPKELLKDPDVSYLLVTSADLTGEARRLLVNSPTQWHRLRSMPRSLAKALPSDASGRVAVWHNLDQERIELRINDLLIQRFRVPQSHIETCIRQLEEGALERMRGNWAGVWKREDVVEIIETLGGYDGTAKDLAIFVPPGNWGELLAQLKSRNAIVLTGPSGTGKTTTAKALIASMREENPQLAHIKIKGGPERLRDDITTGPVIFEIEDPWGKYRAEPDSLPWNDAINGFLASASPSRIFVITSRSDVMQDASLTSLDQRYKANLLADHYRSSDRRQLFELRLRTLPRAEQRSAHRYQSTVVKELMLPLEMDRFFGAAGLGPKQDEGERTFVHRCIEEARSQSIESALTRVIERQEKWEAAAVLWALLKARKRLTFSVLEDLEEELSSSIPTLEDRLSTLASTLIAGGTLRQDKSEFSFAHPRVGAGLEKAMLVKPVASSRTLSRLLDALVALDGFSATDWGTETAAHVISEMSSISGLRRKFSKPTQEHVDKWLTHRLASLDVTFRDDLALAAKVGSQDCDVAELARWLDESPVDHQWFNMTSWKEPKKPSQWYERLAQAPHTFAICDAFITRVIGFRSGWFDRTFHKAIEKFSPSLTPSFCAALREIITHGYSPNVETLISGAIGDLASYEAVFDETTAHLERRRMTRDRSALLALYNRNYDEDVQEHFWENMGEEGYTASEILKAYIHERRTRGEWHVLTERPNRSGFLWEWIHVAQRSEEAPPVQELVALGAVSSDSDYEDEYWRLVVEHFDGVLVENLQYRLREGSRSDAVRKSAASAALMHAPDLIRDLFSSVSGVSTQRLLELALDVQACPNDGALGQVGEGLGLDTLIASADQTIKEASWGLLGSADAEVSEVSIALIGSIPLDAPTALNLSVARALSKSRHDVAVRLKHVLSSTLDVTEENIELAVQAMKLGASCEDQDLINLGLQHDFARVRIEAMNAMFDQSSGPLSQEILSKKDDPSSLVRRRLVEMLKDRPHTAHVSTLVKLSYDTWTPDHHHQRSEVSYPIAEGAVDILREEESLGDDVYRKLIKSLNASDNKRVRLQLLRTMVRHGSPSRQENLIKIAIGEGRPTLQRLTSQALFLESGSLVDGHHSLVDDATLTEVSPEVCIWICLLMLGVAPTDRLLQVAQLLASNASRRVFVALLYLFYSHLRGGVGNEAIAGLLPKKIRDDLKKILETGSTDNLSCLDDLGDVRSVELIKDSLRSWINPKGKVGKNKKRQLRRSGATQSNGKGTVGPKKLGRS